VVAHQAVYRNDLVHRSFIKLNKQNTEAGLRSAGNEYMP
jgi:hypothetical protein